MAAAIAANRKTQTRRLIRFPPHSITNGLPEFSFVFPEDPSLFGFAFASRPPFHLRAPAAPGDTILVCEPHWRSRKGHISFPGALPEDVLLCSGWRRMPGRYLPTALVRLRRTVTAVRLERLHALTPADSFAEGCPLDHPHPRDWFCCLWNSLHPTPHTTWADNPWVWVLSFA
jgi:hypothetical protein